MAAAPIGILVLAGHGNALFWAAVCSTLASLTDLLDGPLARRGRKVSPFGIYLDTTGDKVLVSVVLIAMSSAHMLDPWMVMIDSWPGVPGYRRTNTSGGTRVRDSRQLRWESEDDDLPFWH